MQTFKIEVEDSIADKILWFLNSFNEVKIEDFKTNNIDEISLSITKALKEVKEADLSNKKLDNAWDILDEL
ncbi:hypothetical protein MNB_SV-15-604 [hydrothermal vent metagenome]|uniref:Uncharacterized protein n=1 Tax=hydrothermal vent metagenome TaxID=652676 RepID=A0A1W1EJZ8_9ZZZZ